MARCGALGASSLAVSVADFNPVDVGLKVIDSLQLRCGPRLVPQLLALILKLVLPVRLRLILLSQTPWVLTSRVLKNAHLLSRSVKLSCRLYDE